MKSDAAHLRVGTRGSQLARWQANAVAARVTAAGGPRCELVVIRTTGDELQRAPLSEAGGKRLFVKEIEDALLRGDIDLAVHSSKDMPAVLPDGLAIGGVLPREDPHDAVVLPVRLRPDTTYALDTPADVVSAFRRTVTSVEDLLATLGQTPSIGTSSVRRVAQLLRLFPRARFEPIRGNLDTRLRKLDDGAHEAIVLAAAGLRRLGFHDRISFALPADVCVPAPGQGIVAMEIREDDAMMRDMMARISDATAFAALQAERAVVDALGGGCQTPIGALATVGSSQSAAALEVLAIVAALDGSRVVRSQASGPIDQAVAIGRRAAEQLLAQGAEELLTTATGD